MLREATQSSFYSWKHLQHDSEGEPCFHTCNSYTKFSNSSTYIFLFRLFIFCDTHINTVSSRCKNTRVQHKVMKHVGCICAVKVHLRYILVLPSPQTVEYNCMFTCHQQFLEGSALMPF
jgi:hypothetical protein